MKKTNFLFLLIILSAFSYGKVGDTTFIRTIDHNTPVLPGWLSPRDGQYQFPTGKRWEKILMYYNLECDPSQNPKCGEWDYLSYTNIMEHTGIFDTPQKEHPWFLVNGKNIDKVEYINGGIAYKYQPIVEETIKYTKTNSLVSNVINLGAADVTISRNESNNARAVVLYKNSEITQSNASKKITGLNLTLSPTNKCSNARVRIEMKKSSGDLSLPTSLEKMTTVYYATVALTSGAKIPFHFTTPFVWDEKYDLTVSYSFDNMDNDIVLKGGNNLNVQGRDLHFTNYDGTADMGYYNYIEVPVSELNKKLDKDITISFWAYGHPSVQPQDASVFEAVDSKNNRLLNAHMPWSDGKIYWDCLSGRASKASPPTNWEGKWTYWTFVRSATGAMSIYMNGKTFSVGTGTKDAITGIDKFRIAASITYGPAYYGGAIDNFYIFNKALTKAEATSIMYNDIKPTDELYTNLVLGYGFDELDGATINDIKGISDAKFVNNITRRPQSSSRFKNYTTNGSIPNVELEFREYESTTIKTVTEDISELYNSIIEFYKVEGTGVVVEERKFITPAYYKDYVYDMNGIAIDSTQVKSDGEYTNKKLEYEGEPIEQLKEWEIGRYITPYGNGLDLGEGGWTWIYDVTDFAPLLQGNVHLRSGNFQELLDLRFIMIEGVPDRDVIQLENVWRKRRINLSTFDEEVTEKEFTMPENARTLKLRTTLTGHDFDNATNCAEFCDKLHSIWVNGDKKREWQIIKPCGANPLYPQGGTWLYDRAGWCPGEPAVTQHFELTDYLVDGKVRVDYNIESDPYGVYDTDSQIVYYTDLNHQTDIAMEAILTPNSMKIYGRFNPSCGDVIVIIHNKGKNTITNATINYGLEGKVQSKYTWNGNLKYNEMDTVVMNAPEWDYKLTRGQFYAEVITAGDEYPTNNKMTSTYSNVKLTDAEVFQFDFKTNKKPKDTRWILSNLNTGWTDEVDVSSLKESTKYTYNWELVAGCYRLTLIDESGDGLAFWALPYGSGSAELSSRNLKEGSTYKLFHKFNPDFGAFTYFDFVIDPSFVGTNDIAEDYNVKIYPNPVENYTNIAISGYEAERVVVYNMSGKIVMEYNVNSNSYQLNTTNLPSGVYMLKIFITGNNTVTKKMIKK